MHIDFTGMTALVTGATRGIGAAIAEALRKANADLILTGTKPEEMERRNKENEAAGVTNVEYRAADFSDRDSLDAFIETLEREKRIDVCVNNAGINKLNPIDKILTEDLDAVMDVNLRAPFLVCKAVSKLMKNAQYGRIINIASIFGVVTRPERSVYTATKFGLIGMTKTMAAELAPHNILVNSVSPGFVETDMTAINLSSADKQELCDQVPIHRFAQPEEIAKVVLFMASDQNTYLTGQNIVVDGGFVSV